MRHETFSTDDVRAVRSPGPRARLALLCEVRQGTRPWKLVRLSDLSETGFRLAWLPDYDLGAPVRIRIPGMEVLSAKICWQRGKQIGCEFASPLHVAVFENIVRLAGGSAAA